MAALRTPGCTRRAAFRSGSIKDDGEAVPLADEPSTILDSSIAYTAGRLASAAATGTLAHYSGAVTQTQAVWLDTAKLVAPFSASIDERRGCGSSESTRPVGPTQCAETSEK